MTTIADENPMSEKSNTLSYSYTYNNKDYPVTNTCTTEAGDRRYIKTEFHEY